MQTKIILILSLVAIILIAIAYKAGYNSGFKKGFESTEMIVKAAMIIENMNLEKEIEELEKKGEQYKLKKENK